MNAVLNAVLHALGTLLARVENALYRRATRGRVLR